MGVEGCCCVRRNCHAMGLLKCVAIGPLPVAVVRKENAVFQQNKSEFSRPWEALIAAFHAPGALGNSSVTSEGSN